MSNYSKFKFEWFNLKEFLKFTSGNFLFQVVSIVSELYVLKLVTVSEMGLWQLSLLLQGYVVIFRLGILNSYNREYVLETEKGNIEYSLSISQTTSFFTLLSTLLQSISFIICGFFFLISKNNFLYSGVLFAMSVFTIFESLNNFEEAKLRSKFKYNNITRSKFYFALIMVLTLFFPYYLGFKGLILRAILNQVIFFFIFRIFDSENYSIKFSFSTWKLLFKDGWKFWLLSYIKTFSKSIPKLFLATFAGVATLGLFTPINWVMLAFTTLTGNLTAYIYPIFTQLYAKGNHNIEKYSIQINFLTLFFILPCIGFIYFLTPYLIVNFLPKYSESISAIRIGTFSIIFEIFTLSTSLWYARKEWYKLFLYYSLTTISSLLVFLYVYLNQGDLLLQTCWAIFIVSFLSAFFIGIVNLFTKKLIRLKSSK